MSNAEIVTEIVIDTRAETEAACEALALKTKHSRGWLRAGDVVHTAECESIRRSFRVAACYGTCTERTRSPLEAAADDLRARAAEDSHLAALVDLFGAEKLVVEYAMRAPYGWTMALDAPGVNGKYKHPAYLPDADRAVKRNPAPASFHLELYAENQDRWSVRGVDEKAQARARKELARLGLSYVDHAELMEFAAAA